MSRLCILYYIYYICEYIKIHTILGLKIPLEVFHAIGSQIGFTYRALELAYSEHPVTNQNLCNWALRIKSLKIPQVIQCTCCSV